MKASKQ
jgi:ABC-type multidrug transport system fused ATPase/permease subunit